MFYLFFLIELEPFVLWLWFCLSSVPGGSLTLYLYFFNIILSNFIGSLKSFPFCRDKIWSNKKNLNTYLLWFQIFFLACYFIGSPFLESIILFEVGTLALGSDSHFDVIGDLVQSIRCILLIQFFRNLT